MFRTLQFRFTAAFVAVIAVTVLALGLSVFGLFGQVLQNQYAADYKNNAGALASILSNALGQGQPFSAQIQSGQLQKVVSQLGSQFHMRVRIYAGAGRTPAGDTLVADSSRGTSGLSAQDRAQHRAVDRFSPIIISLRAGTLLVGFIVISEPLTDRAYIEQQFRQTVVWLGVGACLLAFLIGGLLSERLTAPLRVLTTAVTRIGDGNFGERVREGRRDEVGELARQFNRMAARLEESFATISAERDRLRQFVADVSHELRTPLTALRTFNDLLQDGAGEDAATRRDFLGESARQIERLDWLTHNLLDLSRLDAGITQLALRDADLAETLRRAVETNRPAAAAKDVTLAVDAAPLVVLHDPPRFEQAVSNVLSNAVKFSPHGGAVRARAYQDASGAVVEVADEGPGIPPQEAPHVFERFYRGESANRSGAGSGLGLAITKAILDAHHGHIAVESAPGQGTTIRLILPLAAQPQHAVTLEPSPRASGLPHGGVRPRS